MTDVKFSRHATDRLAQRNIWLDQAMELLSKAVRVYPKKIYHSEITQVWKNGKYVFIVDALKKKVITCYQRSQSLFV